MLDSTGKKGCCTGSESEKQMSNARRCAPAFPITARERLKPLATSTFVRLFARHLCQCTKVKERNYSSNFQANCVLCLVDDPNLATFESGCFFLEEDIFS